MTRRSLLLASLAFSSICLSQDISTDELTKLLEKKENVFWLDVREPKELVELGTVPGYVNIPLGQLEKRLAEIPKDKVVVTL